MRQHIMHWQKKTGMYNVPLIENNEIIERPADQTTITKRFSDKAVEFIRENKENKFFIYLAHSLPHTPLYTSDEFLGKSKRGLYNLNDIDSNNRNPIIHVLSKDKMNTEIIYSGYIEKNNLFLYNKSKDLYFLCIWIFFVYACFLNDT